MPWALCRCHAVLKLVLFSMAKKQNTWNDCTCLYDKEKQIQIRIKFKF